MQKASQSTYIWQKTMGNLCAIVMLFSASVLFAQQDTNESMYWATPTLYNPATAGSDSALHITAFDRMQWVGVKDAPQTFFVSADLPIMLGRKRTGLGATILNDKAASSPRPLSVCRLTTVSNYGVDDLQWVFNPVLSTRPLQVAMSIFPRAKPGMLPTMPSPQATSRE